MNTRDGGEFTNVLREAVARLGCTLSGEQAEKMAAHYEMMLRWNRHTNLTRITEARDAAQHHYAETIFGARLIPHHASALDIGSGAGFPAVPVAILRADVSVTALESNQKKAVFLSEVKAALGLQNLQIARARLEEFDWRQFNFLMSRALDRAEEALAPVAERLIPPQTLMLYCAPELAAELGSRLPASYRIETHQIPHTQNRQVAIFHAEAQAASLRETTGA